MTKPGLLRSPVVAARPRVRRLREFWPFALLGLPQTVGSPSAQVQTNAAALSVPVNQLSDEERAQLAKELGYKSIGKELPDGVTLTDIVKSMPAEVC